MKVIVSLVFISILIISITGEDGCLISARQASNSGPAFGGWTEYDLNTTNSALLELVDFADKAVHVYNSRSNDIASYHVTYDANSQLPVREAYTQVVAGINYCLSFKATSDECKNGTDLCKGKTVTCEAKIYNRPWPKDSPIVKVMYINCN